MECHMQETDVIIAGAGPAGCLFALTLRKDISVTILEQKAKEDLGHDWYDGVDMKSIQDYDFANYITKIEDSPPVSFYSPDGSAKLEVPMSGRVDTDRLVLAKTLVEAIEKRSNIRLLEYAIVIDPILEEETIVGVKLKLKGQEQALQARLVVDASGFKAVLRKKLSATYQFERELEPFDTILTFRKYIKRPSNYEKKEHRVFFGRCNGISWINTELPDMIDLFAGVPNFPNQKPPKELVEELEANLKEEVGEEIDLTPIRADYGWIIPTRRCLDNFCGKNFLVMGDAACQVEPINGCGIASGMLAGFLAAKQVNELFESGAELTKETLWPYNYEWIKRLGAQYASIDILRLFLLSRTESDYNFLITHKIITDDELRKSMLGEKIRVSLMELLRKLFHGITRLGLLLALNSAINDADRMKEIYLNYPKQFDAEEFELWQNARDKIAKKYYKKLRMKVEKQKNMKKTSG